MRRLQSLTPPLPKADIAKLIGNGSKNRPVDLETVIDPVDAAKAKSSETTSGAKQQNERPVGAVSNRRGHMCYGQLLCRYPFSVDHVQPCSNDDANTKQAKRVGEIVEYEIPEQCCHRQLQVLQRGKRR